MPQGMVVLPDLDQESDDAQWRRNRPRGTAVRQSLVNPTAQESARRNLRSSCCWSGWASHRNEVALWRWGSEHDARARAAGRSATHCFRPLLTGGMARCRRRRSGRLKDVTAIEAANPAEEAQAIAIALREAVETPERTAALVTPDRQLATRVFRSSCALGH